MARHPDEDQIVKRHILADGQRLFLIAVYCAAMTGCATIMSRSDYHIPVTSSETNTTVKVYKQSKLIGSYTAPGTVDIDIEGSFTGMPSYLLEFSKKGCLKETRMLTCGTDPWVWVDVFTPYAGLVYLIVDYWTGTAFKLDETPIHVELEKVVASDVVDAKEIQKTTKVQSEISSGYRIVNCARESGSDFAYAFVLELTNANGAGLKMFSKVQHEFREAVREDYAASFPSVRKETLHVDFPKYRMDGNRIEGRAVVLTISVVSLSYDPNTRKGILAVRFGDNQYVDAREWVRKNIETLARDKNIALTTGEIPPAAKFYLGREEIKDGNILEVEFKTE